MKIRGFLSAFIASAVAVLGVLVPVQTAQAAVNCTLTDDSPRFIEGTLMYGKTLRGIPGNWEPGTSLTYIWRDADGTELQRGPSDTFVVPANPANNYLQLLVSGDKAGCPTFTRTSEAVSLSPVSETRLHGRIFTGVVAPGEMLTHDIPAADLDQPVRSCRYSFSSSLWSSCDSRLYPTAADAGKWLYVKNTYTSDGVTVQKNSAYKIADVPLDRNQPGISGVIAQGATLKADLATQTVGTTSEVEWCRVDLDSSAVDECNIVGTGATYVLGASDVGKELFLRVKHTEATGVSFIAVSELTPIVAATPVTSIPNVAFVNQWGAPTPLGQRYGSATWKLSLSSAEPTTGVSSIGRYICTVASSCTTFSSIDAYRSPLSIGSQYQPRWAVRLTSGEVYWSVGPITDPLQLGQFGDQTVTISGTAKVGQILTSSQPYEGLGGGQDASWVYQWYRGTTPIPGATSRTYTATPEDALSNLKVEVTISKANYESRTYVSSAKYIATATFTSTPVPTLSGTVAQGQTLTANIGTWDAGANLTYQWNVGGSYNTAETGTTYTITGADAGKTIQLRVTGTKPGYTTVYKDSVATVAVPFQTFTQVTEPTIEGFPSSGLALNANPGLWDDGAVFSYQWLANGTAIPGATSQLLQINDQSVGKRYSVRVTVTKLGYTSQTKTSAQTVAAYLGLSPTSKPTITGETSVDQTLEADPGLWADGVSIGYQWYRNGVAIAGAVSSSYKLVAADAGKKITVSVTGSKVGYAPVIKLSDETSTVFGKLNAPDSLAINGTMSVGKIISVSTEGWDTGVTFTYQWYRNSLPVSGATERLYAITVADLGAGLTVQVSASKAGFVPVSVMATERGPVTPGTLTAPTPTFTGKVAVGQVLTAKAGTWTIGTKLTYQWLRAGKPIAGATKPTYKLAALDKKKAVSVRVTGSLFGYNLVVKTSSAKVVP